MALLKIKDFDPNYKETFGGYDLKGASVYSEVSDEKIGSVDDLLVDEQGHFRYFIVDIGVWGFGKKVLLPVGRSQVDSEGKRVYALGFTKEQAEHLPEFSEDLKIDNNYEERVRGVYRPSEARSIESPMRPTDLPERGVPPTGYTHAQDIHNQPMPPVDQVPPSTPAGYPTQPSSTYPASGSSYPPTQTGYPTQPPPDYNRADPAYPSVMSSGGAGQSSVPQGGYPPNYPGTSPNVPYDYRQDPTLYEMNEQHHSVLQLLENRLRAKQMQSGHHNL